MCVGGSSVYLSREAALNIVVLGEGKVLASRYVFLVIAFSLIFHLFIIWLWFLKRKEKSHRLFSICSPHEPRLNTLKVGEGKVGTNPCFTMFAMVASVIIARDMLKGGRSLIGAHCIYLSIMGLGEGKGGTVACFPCSLCAAQ